MLGSGAVVLPRTSGEAPLTFRIEPTSGRQTLLDNVHITWESERDYFIGPEERYPATVP
ncbi:MAG: hypothetical protein AB7O78_03190 [Thermoleophilia bacterium]